MATPTNSSEAKNRSGSHESKASFEQGPVPFQRASTGDCVVWIKAFETDTISPISVIRLDPGDGSTSEQCRACDISKEKMPSSAIKHRDWQKWEKPILAMAVMGFYIVLGIISQDKCPLEPWLPIWAMGTGIGFVVAIPILNLSSYNFIGDKTNNGSYEENGSRSKRHCSSFKGSILALLGAIVKLALLIWWILGSYFVASMYRRVSYSSNDEDYCDPVLFIITLEFIVVMWIIYFLALIWSFDLLKEDPRFRRTLLFLCRK